MPKAQSRSGKRSKSRQQDKKKTKTSVKDSVIDLTVADDHPLPSPSTSSVTEVVVGNPTKVGNPTLKKTSNAGRPKESPIWDFSRYDEEKEKSTCLVPGCTVKLHGKSASNNKTHLQLHSEVYKEYVALYEKQKELKKGKACSFNQVTLEQIAQSRTPYNRDHPR